jgi:hypothetical protein
MKNTCPKCSAEIEINLGTFSFPYKVPICESCGSALSGFVVENKENMRHPFRAYVDKLDEDYSEAIYCLFEHIRKNHVKNENYEISNLEFKRINRAISEDNENLFYARMDISYENEDFEIVEFVSRINNGNLAWQRNKGRRYKKGEFGKST